MSHTSSSAASPVWADFTKLSALDIAECPGFVNSAILKMVMMVSGGTVVSESCSYGTISTVFEGVMSSG